jgi:hypothetical protein
MLDDKKRRILSLLLAVKRRYTNPTTRVIGADAGISSSAILAFLFARLDRRR